MSSALRDGIAAVKSGQLEKARQLLMHVVELDENNEQAWLWLSGAVETDEDRRVCLENVLTINPGNTAARRGLAKLGPASGGPEADPTGREHVMRREVAPVSTAAAMLHPEAQIKEWRWRDPVQLQQTQQIVESQTVSSFDDVWNTTQTLCGYCAQELAEDARQCPRCQRNLIATEYHYPQPGANLYYLGALTLSLGLQLFFQTYLDISREVPILLTILDGLLTLGLLISAAGVYMRRRWGYLGANVASGIVLFISLIRITTNLTARSELASIIILLVPVANILTSLLNVLLGIFRAGRDFELIEIRHVVKLGETLRRSGDLYHTGKDFAARGLWALAVPYWQRAAANDPTRVFYQLRLGEAYARLGFFERSLSVLEPAAKATREPELLADIERWTRIARERRPSSPAVSARS